MSWQVESAIRHAQETMRLDSKTLDENGLPDPPSFPDPPPAREITYQYVDVFLIVFGSIVIGAFASAILFYIFGGIK